MIQWWILLNIWGQYWPKHHILSRNGLYSVLFFSFGDIIDDSRFQLKIKQDQWKINTGYKNIFDTFSGINVSGSDRVVEQEQYWEGTGC